MIANCQWLIANRLFAISQIHSHKFAVDPLIITDKITRLENQMDTERIVFVTACFAAR